jgi:hypothetical protein
MAKTKTDLGFIHRFMPPKNGPGYEKAEQGATQLAYYYKIKGFSCFARLSL